MKKLSFAILASLTLLISCNKDEDSTTVVGDVCVITQQSGENIVYGLSIHAYSFNDFSNVTVSPDVEPGTTYHLQEYPGFKTDFYYDTPESELTTEMPVTGNYHFTANLENGKSVETDDYLSSVFLIPPVITTCSYDVSTEKASIEWEAVQSADIYVIRLYEDDELVLLSSAIPPNITAVEFTGTNSSWGQGYTPAEGTNFTARIIAYKYETGGDSYNMQASSFAEENLFWGQE